MGKYITLFIFGVLSTYIHKRVCNRVTCNLTSTRYLFPVTVARLCGPWAKSCRQPAFAQPSSCCKKKGICTTQLTKPQPATPRASTPQSCRPLVLATRHPRASPFSSTQDGTHASRLPRASVHSPSCRTFLILGKPALPTQALPVCGSIRWALLAVPGPRVCSAPATQAPGRGGDGILLGQL